MPKQKRKPSYLLHKVTGQARVVIDGKTVYLGEYGSPESRERYDELIAEWFAKNSADRFTLTVDELCILFQEHAATYYVKNGEPTSEVDNIRQALRPLVKLHGRCRVREFGPLKLKDVRQYLSDAEHVRTSINRMMQRIKLMFRWGVENEFVPPELYTALKAVPGLRKGRTKARESKPVQSVAEGTVNDTLPHLPQVVADMVQLQLLTGARPGEICGMRPCDITIGTSGVWTYRPESHKTEHHGKERRIFIGPQGQSFLRPYLDRDSEAFCFSPRDAEAERNSIRRENRQTPCTPSQIARDEQRRKQRPKRKRPPAERYTKDDYNRAIRRACERAEVERWTPNQLRHSRATILRERYGIEAAAVVLGHSDARLTAEVYAERDFEAAARIMHEVG